jgi:hypothetical protein
VTHRKSIRLDKIGLSGFLDPLSDFCLVFLRDTQLLVILLCKASHEVTERGGQLGKTIGGRHCEESTDQ